MTAKNFSTIICIVFLSSVSSWAGDYYLGANINNSQMSSSVLDDASKRSMGASIGIIFSESHSFGLDYIGGISSSQGTPTTVGTNSVSLSNYDLSQYLVNYAYYFTNNAENSFYLPVYLALGSGSFIQSTSSVVDGSRSLVSSGVMEVGSGLGLGYQHQLSDKMPLFMNAEIKSIFFFHTERINITNISLGVRLQF